MPPTARKIISLLLVILLTIPSAADAARPKKKKAPAYAPKFSSIVINAKTGQMLTGENPDAARYPASLTKMMTLYLTFEALKKGKLRLSEMMQVSVKASTMPPTNVFLEPGDRISVKDAIQALVVRSANDVAVVLAERLGDTEWNFAVMMSAKARELGMKNTTFRNASGLPDPGQRTTARDMAKLGMALKRDFPEYFSYFKTTQFVFHGRTYNTHNRVMLRYPGADGIKTGYINASGFNLVTSVTKNGVPLIAAIIGGKSGQIRDNQMIALLDNTYTQIAQGKIKLKEPETMLAEAAPQKTPPSKFAAATSAPTLAPPAPKPAAPATAAPERVLAAAPPPPVAKTPVAAAPKGKWGIQVGAFARQAEAYSAIQKALYMAKQELIGSQITVVDGNNPKANLHRARLMALTESQARDACRKLVEQNAACFVVRGGQAS